MTDPIAVSQRAREAAELLLIDVKASDCEPYMSRAVQAFARFEAEARKDERATNGWRDIETMPLWEVGVVTDGERACISQKAQGDFDEGDEHYFAVDPEDALEWQPTHWIPAPATAISSDGGE